MHLNTIINLRFKFIKMTEAKKDADMKDVEEKKEEKKEVVQEVHDPFYGIHPLF